MKPATTFADCRAGLLAVVACVLITAGVLVSRAVERHANRVVPGAADVTLGVPPAPAEAAPVGLVDSTIDGRIDRYRKGDAVVRALDCDGRPAAGVEVKVEQLSHDFPFGFGLPDDDRLRAIYSADEIEKLYGCWDRVFNAATPQNAFKLSGIQPSEGSYDFAVADAAADWCVEHDKRMKIHCLLWQDGLQGQPDWIMGLSGDKLRDALVAHADRVISRYRDLKCRNGDDLVYAVDAINEPLHCERPFDLPPGFYRDFFASVVRMLVADNRQRISLVINEWGLECDQMRSDRGAGYYRLARELPGFVSFLAAEFGGAGAPAVGLQCHAYQVRCSEDQLRSTIDALVKAGVPEVHISELMFPSDDSPALGDDIQDERAKALNAGQIPSARPRWTEEYQAETLEWFYRLCFAQPEIASITWWDTLDEPSWRNCREGLIRRDLSTKPAYTKLDGLINGKWRTRVDGRTGPDGSFSFRGFFGRYSVTVKGTPHAFTIDAGRAGSAQELTVTVE